MSNVGIVGKVCFICCRFLVNPTKDIDLRKWAAEGLAYLTLDADVKEDLVTDTPALKSLMDLAKVRPDSPALMFMIMVKTEMPQYNHK